MMPPMAADPRSPAPQPGIAPDPAEPVVRAVTTSGGTGTAVLEALEQTGTMCPYLRMADGSHRALGVSREHRCWAVEPPSTLPGETQTELCLSSSFGRCERFVAAQDRRAAGLASDHIPARLVTSPRFAIPVDPVPVVVDARTGSRDQGAATPMAAAAMRRRLPLIAAAVAVLVVGGLGLAALLGGLSGQPAPSATPLLAAAGSSTSPTTAPATAPMATPVATPAPTPGAPTPAASDGAVVVPQVDPTPTEYPTEIARMYRVKEGDTYRTLARRFGVKPRDLRALNGPLRVGDRIAIPAGPWVTDAPDE